MKKIGNVVAHPDHIPTGFALEPHGSPLRGPVVWIENLVTTSDLRRKPQHIDVSAQKEWFPQPSQWPSTNFSDGEGFTNIWKAVQRIIYGGVQSYRMPVLS
jgi:hypothetical protein